MAVAAVGAVAAVIAARVEAVVAIAVVALLAAVVALVQHLVRNASLSFWGFPPSYKNDSALDYKCIVFLEDSRGGLSI